MKEKRTGNKPLILFKYGGNAMVDEGLKERILQNICALQAKDYAVVIVHGGGPFIKQALEDARIESEFIDGHRKTTAEAFKYVEMALKGNVNGSLVAMINAQGYRAVGLSGKDGPTVIATQRHHQSKVNGRMEEVDLGRVGDVARVDTTLVRLLLDNNFVPVITCLAADEKGRGYNINGDMFAGHLAGALGATHYVVLTDVDGLLRDKDDPSTLIRQLTLDEIEALQTEDVIQGGMIPKMESCEIAINKGAESARIINGTKPTQILDLVREKSVGTTIRKS